MKVTVFGEHLEVTDAIENYIINKFSHLHRPDKLTKAEFKIGSNKNDKYVHFHANIPGEELFIQSTDKNLYHAIDSLMKKIHIAFVKEKDKHKQKLSAWNN